MIGLEQSGKTAILFRLKQDAKFDPTHPTIGYNKEDIQFGGNKLIIWDLGGQHAIRSYWIMYYPGTSGIVFVVDSTDR